MLAGVALTATPSAANAQSAPSGARVITLPCDSAKLPSAITTANMASSGIIRLARNCTYDTSNTLTITGKITLLGGPSTTISRRTPTLGNTFRVLNVAQNASLRVQGIFILNGNAGTGEGGGILNAGNLELHFTTLSGHTASNGGALLNTATGSAQIANSIIKTSRATGVGGGIDNRGMLTLFESFVSGNTAAAGGGILTDNTGLTRVIQSTIDKNTTSQQGGGIFNSTTGRTSLDRTLVQQNGSDSGNPNSGGGILNNNGTAGSVTLRRSIVRRNTPSNCVPTIPGCLG